MPLWWIKFSNGKLFLITCHFGGYNSNGKLFLITCHFGGYNSNSKLFLITCHFGGYSWVVVITYVHRIQKPHNKLI